MKNKRRSSLVSGTPGRTIRAVPNVEIRALDGPDDEQGTFEAIVLRYNIRDDYNTEFAPGLFDESLNTRLPRIAWGHDWREMVGQWIDWRSTPDYLWLKGKLDLAMTDIYSADGEVLINRVPAVPLAHQAWAQLKSGTADQFSVGFVPTEWQDVETETEWYRIFTKGRLDEVSIVLAGAVPGTALLSVRSVPLLNVREPLVSKEKVAALIVRLNAGEVDLADALGELKTMPVEAEAEADDPDDVDDPDDDDEPDATPPEGETPPIETAGEQEADEAEQIDPPEGLDDEPPAGADEDLLDELDDEDMEAALELAGKYA